MKLVYGVVFTVIFAIYSCGVDRNNVDWAKFPKTPVKVPWEDIVVEFERDNVVSAGQNHKRQVSIQTKDYRYLISIEPNIDDITKLVKEIDPKFKNISYVTE